MTLTPYIETEHPGLVEGLRRSVKVSAADIDPFVAGNLLKGEWAVPDADGVFQRPLLPGGLNASPEIDFVIAGALQLLLTGGSRTDIRSASKVTGTLFTGTTVRTNLYNTGLATFEVGSGADLVITANLPDALSNTLASAGGFGAAVAEGDTVTITGGTFDGVSFIIPATSAVAGVQDVNTILEEVAVSDVFAAGDAGPNSFVVTRTVSAPVTGVNLRAALYQHPDTPASLICGLIADDADLTVSAVDGVTPELIVGIGPVVAQCLHGPHQRNNAVVIEAVITA